MKNKKLIFILLPAAVLIWTLVILQAVKRMNGPGETSLKTNFTIDSSQIKNVTDNYRLLADYSDPFLKSADQQGSPIKTITPVILKFSKEVDNRSVISWPEINYGGVILNKNNNQQVYLLKINTKQYLLHQGESADKVELIKAYRDSVKVMFGGGIKTIFKVKP